MSNTSRLVSRVCFLEGVNRLQFRPLAPLYCRGSSSGNVIGAIVTVAFQVNQHAWPGSRRRCWTHTHLYCDRLIISRPDQVLAAVLRMLVHTHTGAEEMLFLKGAVRARHMDRGPHKAARSGRYGSASSPLQRMNVSFLEELLAKIQRYGSLRYHHLELVFGHISIDDWPRLHTQTISSQYPSNQPINNCKLQTYQATPLLVRLEARTGVVVSPRYQSKGTSRLQSKETHQV